MVAPAGVGYAVMNVSTGVNQSAGRSRPVAVKLPISADCVADRNAADADVVDEVLEAPVLGLPGASEADAERRLAGVEHAERRRERHDPPGSALTRRRR